MTAGAAIELEDTHEPEVTRRFDRTVCMLDGRIDERTDQADDAEPPTRTHSRA
jgi:hypothetical protein